MGLEQPDRSNRNNSLGRELLRQLQTCLLPAVAARMLAFTVTMVTRPLVFKARGEGERAIYNATKLAEFPRCSVFSRIEVPWIAVNFWLLSRVLKKFIFDNFCQYSDCFYGGVVF